MSPVRRSAVQETARKVVEDYLRAQESAVYDAILAELARYVPDPTQPLRDLTETMSSTLAILGVTATPSELAAQVVEVVPQEIVRPLADLYGVISPRLEWAMAEIVKKAKPAVSELRDAVLAPIEARIREIFHLAFTAVVRKVAEVVGHLADAAVARLMEAVEAILERLVEAAMAAMRKIIEMAVRALAELVDKIGRMVLRMATAVATWIARQIAMFVLKMILKVIALLFGLPSGYVETTWIDTQALIRI
ncbi:MAG: hypothetical protein JWN02_2166 [Acidobacteria bacterium]|nr:hypothetical protein [Acidobacteriota bacterium]